MKKYRKRPVVVEAKQWFKHGDHDEVTAVKSEGKCYLCGDKTTSHGRIRTLEGLFGVCPGDWIVKSVKGEHYAVKPDIFDKTYEEA